MSEPPSFAEYLSSADPAEIRDLQRRNAQLEKQLERYRSGDRIIRETIREIFSTHAPLRIPPPPRVSRAKQRELVEVKMQNQRMRALLEEQRGEYAGYLEVIQAIDEALGFTEEE